VPTGAYVWGTHQWKYWRNSRCTEQRDGELKLVLKALSAFRRGEQRRHAADRLGRHLRQAGRGVQRTELADRAHHAQAQVGGDHLPAGRQGKPPHPDDKLTGFWQDNVATMNLLVDEWSSVSGDNTRALLKA
jgi:hypothetical protein